jgi:hypothetical protein
MMFRTVGSRAIVAFTLMKAPLALAQPVGPHVTPSSSATRQLLVGAATNTRLPTIIVSLRPETPCGLDACITTWLVNRGVSPTLFYLKAPLMGGAQRADYKVQLCSYIPSKRTTAEDCWPEFQETYLADGVTRGELSGRTPTDFSRPPLPQCFVLRWEIERRELFSTPFSIWKSDDDTVSCK